MGTRDELGERARLLRQGLGIELEQLARVSSIPVAKLLSFEQHGTGLGSIELITLADVLGADLHSLLSGGDELRSAVSRLFSAWGPSGRGPSAAATAVAHWAQEDELVTLLASPEPARIDSLAGRGIPEAGPSALTHSSLPALGARDGATAQDLLEEIQESWPGLLADPWSAADEAGVAAGLHPLGQDLLSASTRLLDGFAVVVNSDLPPAWRATGLRHALLHLALGHVLLGSYQPVEDLQDDSISSCSAISWQLCSLVEEVVTLIDPNAQRPRGSASSGPLRAPGELPGYWEQYDVPVAPVRLHQELGLPHPCLYPPGDGSSSWPPALARRVLAAASRGRRLRQDQIRSIPLGAAGCSVEEVERAIHRGRTIRHQLEQAHRLR